MNGNASWQKVDFRKVYGRYTQLLQIRMEERFYWGVKEYRDSFTVNGLNDRQLAKYQKNFWSTINDRNKVSKNILLNHHVKVIEYEGKNILE